MIAVASGLFFGRAAGDELHPFVEPLAPGRHERPVHQTFRGHHVCHGVDHCDIGPRSQLEVVLGLDVRGTNQIDAAGVDHDELRALTQPLLHPGRKYRVAVGRVGPDHQDDVGLRHRTEVLRAR
jgi:hypothetical protein